MDESGFFIKAGYRSSSAPKYFEDNIVEKDSIIWQPEVYPLARALARRLGCKRIVDLGCGRAKKLLECAPEFEIIGVDFGGNLQFCREHHSVGKWVEWDLESGQALPLSPADLASSVVVCADVIEHLVNPLPLLENLRRLLEVSTIAVLSTPERDLLRGVADLGPPGNACHVREWNLRELTQLLCARGLRVDFGGLTSSNSLNGIKDSSVTILSHPQRRREPWLDEVLTSGPAAITAAGDKILVREAAHRPYQVLSPEPPKPTRTWFDSLLVESASPRRKDRRIGIVSCEIMGPHRNGGIGTAYTTMAEVLASAGHQVTLLDTGERPENPEKWIQHFAAKGIRYLPLPPLPFPLGGCPPATLSYTAFEWLRTQDFDVLHFPEYRGVGFYSVLAKHQGLAFENTLLCVGTHSSTAWCKQGNGELWNSSEELQMDFLERESVRWADVVISPSRYLLHWMQEQGWKLPSACFVQPNLSPASAQRPATTGKNRTLPVRELVFFGRLEQRKGVRLFCDALDQLQYVPEMAGLKVSFLGRCDKLMVEGRPSAEYIQERAGAWPWEWQILSDYAHTAALDYLGRDGCLAVIPSAIENSPYTVLECLEAGVPFIASRIGGIPELIAPEDLDRCTFQPSTEALAEKLRQTVQTGVTRVRPDLDGRKNEQVWVAWHESFAVAPPPAAAAAAGPWPLVSVCLCHHNRPKLLADAIASIEAQDYPNFEVVLVDDGSGEPKAVQYLDQLAPRFAQRGWQLIRQNNCYLGTARNNAAERAKGEYLLFMDDDNVAKPNELSTFIRVARKTGADILTTLLESFTGNQLPENGRFPCGRWLFPGAPASAGAYLNTFGDANMLIRRDVFLALGGFAKERNYGFQDWELLARASLQGFHLETVPEVLFYYRILPDSMVRNTGLVFNHSLALRAYMEMVPASFRPILSLAKSQHLYLASLPPRAMVFDPKSPIPSLMNRLFKKLLSSKWRGSLRKRLATLQEWFAD